MRLLDALRRVGATPRSERPFAVPEGMRVYAVGDIHGCAHLLDGLAKKIVGDLKSAPEKSLTIFLGDYVDRGPLSREVLEKLSSGNFPTPCVALRGNHEDLLLQALQDAATIGEWRKLGGLETLVSYGVDVAEVMSGRGYEDAGRELAKKMPDSHVKFLKTLPSWHAIGDYYFCHAGVRPGVELARQDPRDLAWRRDEFLSSSLAHGAMIVHGHSPVDEPEFRPNRINIDTGAYATGRLSCLVLEGTIQRML